MLKNNISAYAYSLTNSAYWSIFKILAVVISSWSFGNFYKAENLKEYKSQRYVEPDPESSDEEIRIHRSLDPKDEEKENKPNFAIFKAIFTKFTNFINPFWVFLWYLIHAPSYLKSYLLHLIDFYIIDPLIMIDLRSKNRERNMFRYGKCKMAHFKWGLYNGLFFEGHVFELERVV